MKKGLAMNNNKLLCYIFSFLILFSLPILLQAAGGGSSTLPYAESPDEHFHPKGKPPSEHTLKIIREARKTLPLSDKQDFEEAEKGFIAPLKSKIIEADAGHTA